MLAPHSLLLLLLLHSSKSSQALPAFIASVVSQPTLITSTPNLDHPQPHHITVYIGFPTSTRTSLPTCDDPVPPFPPINPLTPSRQSASFLIKLLCPKSSLDPATICILAVPLTSLFRFSDNEIPTPTQRQRPPRNFDSTTVTCDYSPSAAHLDLTFDPGSSCRIAPSASFRPAARLPPPPLLHWLRIRPNPNTRLATICFL